MTTNIDMQALRNDAVEIFNHGFACSESVIYAIKKHFDLDLSDDAIAMSSGFPWVSAEVAVFAVLLPAAQCALAIFLADVRLMILQFRSVLN